MDNGPVDLVLVRHGESEGNLAQLRSKLGNQADWQGDFKERHTSHYRLTDRGRLQAKEAGEYIRNNLFKEFDKYFASEYVRAIETASLLGFDAQWNLEFLLRERDKGVLGGLSKKQRKQKYADELKRRDRDSFYWQPPGGESIANMCIRVKLFSLTMYSVERFLNFIQTRCSGLRILVVCHGNIMEGFRLRLEGLTQFQYFDLRSSTDPRDRLHNCQILWYSRRNPKTKSIGGKTKYLRSICPWNTELSYNEWQRVSKKKFSNAELNAQANEVHQLVNNEAHENEEALKQDLVDQTNKLSASQSMLDSALGLHRFIDDAFDGAEQSDSEEADDPYDS